MKGSLVLATLLVAGAVLVAGCNTQGPGTPTDAGADPDGAVATHTAERGARVAPGVSESAGLVDAAALLTAHRRTLAASGFVYEFDHSKDVRVTFRNGTERRSVDFDVSGRVAAEGNLSRVLVERTDAAADPTTSTARYFDAGGSVERSERGGNVTVEPSDEEPIRTLPAHYMIRPLVTKTDWTVTAVGDDAVVLEVAPAWSDWQQVPRDGNVVEQERLFFGGRLEVSRNGLVLSLDVNATTVTREEYNGALLEKRHTVRRLEYELLERGGTDVERPDWAARALNATSTGGNGTATSSD